MGCRAGVNERVTVSLPAELLVKESGTKEGRLRGEVVLIGCGVCEVGVPAVEVGVPLRKPPGAANGGILPGQRAADAADRYSRQSPVPQTISVVSRRNNRVGGS
jgi:hypothetical protein